MTNTEQLILNGLHILMRAAASPNSPDLQAKHFLDLRTDILAWMEGYSLTMAAEKIEDTAGTKPVYAGTHDQAGKIG